MNDTYYKIIDLIFTAIIGEGGDGDAIWLSKYKSLDEIVVLIQEYDEKHNIGWEFEISNNFIQWGTDQEWVTITNDENYFKDQQYWHTLAIRY